MNRIEAYIDSGDNVQMKYSSAFKDEPNLTKTGPFCTTIIIELDAWNDPMHPIYNINKCLEGIISKNNKDFCNTNPKLLPRDIIIGDINSNI